MLNSQMSILTSIETIWVYIWVTVIWVDSLFDLWNRSETKFEMKWIMNLIYRCCFYKIFHDFRIQPEKMISIQTNFPQNKKQIEMRDSTTHSWNLVLNIVKYWLGFDFTNINFFQLP